MQRRLLPFLVLGIVACLPAAAHAVTTYIAGNHALLPNTPGQVIQLTVSSDDVGLQGVNVAVTTGDGGPNNGGAIPAPIITAIDIITGTIFAANNTGQGGTIIGPDQYAFASTTTTSGTVNANGVLASLTIDTTGFFAGNWLLSVSGNNVIGFPPTDGAGSTGVTDAYQDGSLFIEVVPEPSTIVLGLFAAAGMAAVVIRRRRSA